jgi:hypothetical protein
MSLFRHILVRKLLAFFLMAVLLFIQGVQLLHRHHYTPLKSSAVSSGLDKFTRSAHACAICDYHLAKDAELPHATVSLQALPYHYIVYSFRQPIKYAGLLQAHTNKGPPVV